MCAAVTGGLAIAGVGTAMASGPAAVVEPRAVWSAVPSVEANPVLVEVTGVPAGTPVLLTDNVLSGPFTAMTRTDSAGRARFDVPNPGEGPRTLVVEARVDLDADGRFEHDEPAARAMVRWFVAAGPGRYSVVRHALFEHDPVGDRMVVDAQGQDVVAHWHTAPLRFGYDSGDRLRRRSVRPVTAEPMDAADPVREPAELVVERAVVADALCGLPPEQALALRAIHWGGRSAADVARELSVPDATVRGWVLRGCAPCAKPLPTSTEVVVAEVRHLEQAALRALGALPPEEEAELEAALAEDASLRREVEQLAEVVRLLPPNEPVADVGTPPNLGSQVVDAVAVERRRSRRRSAVPAALGAAAAVLVVAGVAAAAGLDAAPPEVPVEAIELAATGGMPLDFDAGIVSHTWGMELRLDVDGTVEGADYAVGVRSADGRSLPAGGFVGDDDLVVRCVMNVALLREEAAAVVVTDAAGAVVAQVELPPSTVATPGGVPPVRRESEGAG